MSTERYRRDKPKGRHLYAGNDNLADRTPSQSPILTHATKRIYCETKKNDNVDELARKLCDCEDSIAKVERTVDYQENQSRRCNLRFDGIPDAENETSEQAEKTCAEK